MQREVPPKFKELLEIRAVKKLTLKERFRLILGYHILVHVRIVTEHKVGRTKQAVKVELTDRETDPPTLGETPR